MNLLLIAYYFPPDSSSGSFRPLFFANHLSQAGFGVEVITAREEDYLGEQSIDPRLLDQLHPQVEVTRCRVVRLRERLTALGNRVRGGGRTRVAAAAVALQGASGGSSLWQKVKDTLSDLLVTPDPQVGWIPDCVHKGREAIARRRPDLILATGGPWSSLLAAVLLKRGSGVPLIVDFRDPWVGNPNLGRRSAAACYLSRRLEPVVVSMADGIIVNTDPLREEFLRRYPFLEESRITTITNGFEEYIEETRHSPGDKLTIVHTGELYLSRNPCNVLSALKRLMEHGVIAPEELSLVLAGGLDQKEELLASLLADPVLARVVTVLPRVPYLEAQQIAGAADLLLLIQPDLPLQVPRKLFEYIALGKPILSVSEAGSATSRLVLDNGLGVISSNTVPDLCWCLEKVISSWRAGSLRFDGCACSDRFLNATLTLKLRRFIEARVGLTVRPADAVALLEQKLEQL